MTSLKIPNVEARLDAFVSYVTDASPLFAEHKKFFAEHHPEGKAFAEAVTKAGSDVLAHSAKLTIEQEEAKAATAAQAAAIAKARAVVTTVRKRGEYIINELTLRDDPDSAAQARVVRVACGIGLRTSVSSQTGLRRIIVVQQEGMKRVKDVFKEFKQPNLLPALEEALKAIDDSIRAQSKEQSEADSQQGVLEVSVQQAAQQLERAVRLLNALDDDAPEGLVRGLLGLEGRHWRVFSTGTASNGAGSDDTASAPAPAVTTSTPAEPEPA